MATNDIYCEWNGDFQVTPNGSLLFVNGWPQVREKIIRIILTNSALTLPDGSTTAPDYIFDPGFGQSAGALIDQNPTQQYLSAVKQRITAAILGANLSDTLPTVKITQPAAGTLSVFVAVTISGSAYQTTMKMS